MEYRRGRITQLFPLLNLVMLQPMIATIEPGEVASAARVADSSTREPSAAKIGRQPALPLEISGQQGTPCTQPLRQKYESFFLRERDWQSHSQPRIAAAHLEDFPRFQICFDILLRPPDRSHLFFRHKLCLILQVWRSFL
jgi:hypothetical protein